MRILILGSKGNLGSHIKNDCEENNIQYIEANREDFDLENDKEIISFFTKNKDNFDILVYTSCITDLDYCEEFEDKAHNINVKSVKRISNLCRIHKKPIIYISSGTVFTNTNTSLQTNKPNDKKNPLSVYAKTKSLAEDIVLMSSINNVIIRTSWLYSNSNKDSKFISKITDFLLQNKKIYISDSYGKITYIPDLSRFILINCKQIFDKKFNYEFRIKHYTDSGILTKLSLVKYLHYLTESTSEIEIVEQSYFKTKAPRVIELLESESINNWVDNIEKFVNIKKEKLKTKENTNTSLQNENVIIGNFSTYFQSPNILEDYII